MHNKEIMMSDETDSNNNNPLVWVIAISLVVLVGYQVYSGVFMKKIGMLGFEIEFGENASFTAKQEIDTSKNATTFEEWWKNGVKNEG